MDIFFQDPSEVPLPPKEVRIRSLRADPWPDQQRVKVYLEVDPFLRQPNVEVFIKDSQGQVLAQASVIESMTRKMEFTLHLRQPRTEGQYTVSATLFYSEPIPEPKEGEETPLKLPESTVVDEAQANFVLDGG